MRVSDIMVGLETSVKTNPTIAEASWLVCPITGKAWARNLVVTSKVHQSSFPRASMYRMVVSDAKPTYSEKLLY